MLTPGQTERVEEVTKCEVSLRREGACSKATASAGGCFPRMGVSPPFPSIRHVICLLVAFQRNVHWTELQGPECPDKPPRAHADVSDTVS